jgi:hypothetical protein
MDRSRVRDPHHASALGRPKPGIRWELVRWNADPRVRDLKSELPASS